MATNTQDSTSPPLIETTVHNNKAARVIELLVLSLLLSLLVYRLVYIKDQYQYLPWLLAFLCEPFFTLNWMISMRVKWYQRTTKTYPERLSKWVSESEFPHVDIFVTTADAILEPSILTMNTMLSLLAVDYPTEKLALYLSDDGCSPITFYSLVETTKFAKLWVPFCKKFNVQVRAPFQYFKFKPSEDDSSEFQQEWKKMKNEYGDLCKKIDVATQRPLSFDHDSEFAVFSGVHRSDHPTIIKVISENKEGNSTDLPHVIYISREKSPQNHHNYKAGAMNVLTRVSAVMTNAPLMLNVDCDMYANNPQVFLHMMCMVFGLKKEENYAFFQHPQAYYNALKDDPFGNVLANLAYIGIGMASGQGSTYTGTNCFHRRKPIYGSSPNDNDNIRDEDLHKIFGKSVELRESVAQILSESYSKIKKESNLSSFIEAAIHVASSNYEYGTLWGKQVGFLYGSTTEDILTGLSIHGRGWKSGVIMLDPPAFLGCAPTTYPSALSQSKRWVTGLFKILFTNKNPLLLTIKENLRFERLRFERALGYLYSFFWPLRSIFEICYASLPAYCIITGSHFLPKVNEWAFLVVVGIFVIYNLYGFWECRSIGVSVRMWWNLQRMMRVNAITTWFAGFLTVMMKLTGLSKIVFEVTKKDYKPNDNDDDDDDDDDNESVGRFTFDESPIIVPGVVILLVNIFALVNGLLRLSKVDHSEKWLELLGFGFGEMFCSVWVLLCFWEYLKGLFGNGKYGIPWSTIRKSGALALLFVQLCKR